MPSTHTARRRFLVGAGSLFSASLAGCTGLVPGTGPDEVDAVETTETNRITWTYPADGNEIGYATVEFDRLVRRERLSPALRLRFNSTVSTLAPDDGGHDYRPDWFRFRIGPPASYGGTDTFEARVQPPGQWEGFSAYYDREGVRRRLVVELRNVDTRGTITVPVVLDPGIDALPDRLHCGVTVQATESGTLGRTVRVSERGTLELSVA